MEQKDIKKLDYQILKEFNEKYEENIFKLILEQLEGMGFYVVIEESKLKYSDFSKENGRITTISKTISVRILGALHPFWNQNNLKSQHIIRIFE